MARHNSSLKIITPISRELSTCSVEFVDRTMRFGGSVQQARVGKICDPPSKWTSIGRSVTFPKFRSHNRSFPANRVLDQIVIATRAATGRTRFRRMRHPAGATWTQPAHQGACGYRREKPPAEMRERLNRPAP
jgi:hypothetical protein